MKKLISLLVLCLFTASVSAEVYISDSVYGTNINVKEFVDPELVINTILHSTLYNGGVRYEANTFKGIFDVGVTNEGDMQCIAENVFFVGRIGFNDFSTVKYSIVNYTVNEYGNNIDETGITESFGKGVLVYDAVVHIRKEIPVDVVYSFYQDKFDRSSFGNKILVDGEGLHIEFEDEGVQRVTHKKICTGDCLYN